MHYIFILFKHWKHYIHILNISTEYRFIDLTVLSVLNSSLECILGLFLPRTMLEDSIILPLSCLKMLDV